jgi:hypothetical protein
MQETVEVRTELHGAYSLLYGASRFGPKVTVQDDLDAPLARPLRRCLTHSPPASYTFESIRYVYCGHKTQPAQWS